MKNIKLRIKQLLESKNIFFLSKGKSNYVTYWYRPKYANDVTTCETDCHEDVAIIIQGKLKLENYFTYETVCLYKKIFPTSKIIVSTWENESQEAIDQLKGTGVYIIQSKLLPEHLRKQGSINLQRETSRAGIKIARELNCKYVCKTRSDQRMYNYQSLTFLKKIVDMYSLKKSGAEKRIVACSVGTFSNRLYNTSDLFLFGTINDIERYFSCPQDEREYLNFSDESNQLEYSKQRPGEIWFTSHYLESCGNELRWTLEDSNALRNEYYIIINNEMIDLYWDKYTKLEYRWRSYKSEPNLKEVTFEEWIINQQVGR